MKKLLILSILMGCSSIAFAQSASDRYYVQKCERGEVYGRCYIDRNPSNGAIPSNPVGVPSFGGDFGLGGPLTDFGMNPEAPSGSYNSMVSNVFAFCEGPRPPRRSPFRRIYDQICPAGKTTTPAP